MKILSFFARNSATALLSILLSAFILAGCLYFYMYTQLPNVEQLKDVQLQVPMRIYTNDGKLIAQYGDVRRIPVALDEIPKQLIEAVIATEDQRFFEHPGVDFLGLLRATKELIVTGRKVQGASTITMQVARNFFLSRKKTFSRKINEILLAIKINHDLSKDKILELYFNKIYLGQRAYGVGAAAQVYYGKPLNQLSLAQLAMIAGLPQAPSRDNPIANPAAAKNRRDHVLWRMYEQGYIDKSSYLQARAQPITASYHGQKIQAQAPYVAEMVRDALVKEFGEEKAYNSGLKVYTTLNAKLQQAANKALIKGLIAYDHRHGYRGAIDNLGNPTTNDLSNWLTQLQKLPTIHHLMPAVIISVKGQSATALTKNDEYITIPWDGLSWARPAQDSRWPGPAPTSASDVVKPGDVVMVIKQDNGWQLSQLPQVEGALVSVDPSNGAILALVGGFSFKTSHFNRAIQAERQPGSNFKPFVYAAALAKGMTLATIINDAPVVIESYGENSLWRPQNDTRQFYGPTRLKVGLIKSRNLVSIRLLQRIGIQYTLQYLQRFGFNSNNLPASLSLALGSADVTPLQIAAGYAVFANGGYRTKPHFIDRITTDTNRILYQMDPPTVSDDNNNDDNTNATSNSPAPRVISADVAYLMHEALHDVIKSGTGRAANVLNRDDLAGKTGTTNDQFDAWFSGFNRNIETTVWVGFDKPHSLYEYGAQAALPIWIDYMRTALNGTPSATLPQPNNIISVRIDPKTGLLARPGEKDAMFELFRVEDAPTTYANDTNAYITNVEGDNESAQLF